MLLFSGMASLSETDELLWWKGMNVGEERPLKSSGNLSFKECQRASNSHSLAGNIYATGA